MFFLAVLSSVACPLAWSQPKLDAIVNSVSFQSGLPAGGSLATIFCSGVNLKPGIYIAPSSSPLPFELGGFRVIINLALAPILAVVVTPSGEAQVNFQVPLERNASLRGSPEGYPGVLLVCGQPLRPLPPLPTWGAFFSDANGYAVARHASDSSPVTLENPARAGEEIIAYANDFFPVWPPRRSGFPSPISRLSSGCPNK